MSDLPRYLVIAPDHPDLAHLPDEAAAIAEALTAKLLAGDVRLRTVLDYITSRQDEELLGVWICSHADSEGVWLWGDVMSAFALSGLLNTTGLPWVALNTCYSAEWIDIVQRGAAVDAIATIRNVPDKQAWYYGRLIAQNYARSGGNLRNALYRAAPGGATLYRFFPAPTDLVRSHSRVTDSQLEVRLIRIEARLDEMERTAAKRQETLTRLVHKGDRLSLAVFGDSPSHQVGLVRWFRWGGLGIVTNTVILILILWRLLLGG